MNEIMLYRNPIHSRYPILSVRNVMKKPHECKNIIPKNGEFMNDCKSLFHQNSYIFRSNVQHTDDYILIFCPIVVHCPTHSFINDIQNTQTN